MPAINNVGSESPLVEEDWTLTCLPDVYPRGYEPKPAGTRTLLVQGCTNQAHTLVGVHVLSRPNLLGGAGDVNCDADRDRRPLLVVRE